jgi:gas vesicle protein
MDDEINDFAREGEYRSSGANVSLGMTMLFVGLAMGALTALLLAPKTGRQMRRTLRRKYEDARDVMEDFGDQASDWIDKGSDWADKAKSRVAPLAKPFRR